MAEYLSPGVYVEEFDSGSVPMQGVSTSTAGFIGFAEKGPVGGIPLLVTSFADFKRKYGGYLPSKSFGEYRFLAYAVEHFFANGGSRAYISRIAADGSTNAESPAEGSIKKITAKYPGEWGNSLTVTIKPSSKAKTVVEEDITSGDGKITAVRVKNSGGFIAGDVVVFSNDNNVVNTRQLTAVNNNVLELDEPLDISFKPQHVPPEASVCTSELNIDVVCGDIAESYENISFNQAAPGFILKQTEKSELVSFELADVLPNPPVKHPFTVITGMDTASEKYAVKLMKGKLVGLNDKPTVPGGCIKQISSKSGGTDGVDASITFSISENAPDSVSDIKIEGNYIKSISVSAKDFKAGDIIEIKHKISSEIIYAKLESVNDSELTLAGPIDKSLIPPTEKSKFSITKCEFDVIITPSESGSSPETFEHLSLNPTSDNHLINKIFNSQYIKMTLKCEDASVLTPFAQITGDCETKPIVIALSGGQLGTSGDAAYVTKAFLGSDDGPGKRSGIQAFLDNSNVSLIATPGITIPAVQLSLVTHCESTASRFAVLDMPSALNNTNDLINHRNYFDTQYAALYHPWLTVFDSSESRNILIPPSGSVLGIYARTDNTRGVHKAPANEVVRNCMGLGIGFGKGEQDILNPVGINLIRSFPGQGIRVWGARTASSNGLWKYINVRRLFIYIEESIKANTNWVVFEPNDSQLWARVKRTIEVFLTTTWRSGALVGSSTAEAFFVNVGMDTMTQDDIDNGRLICLIGIAPVKPAEFVIFRITQKTATG